MTGYSLVSVVKLCNAGCKVHTTDISCHVIFRGKVVVECHKCTKTGLWMMPLEDLQQEDACSKSDQNQQDACLQKSANESAAFAMNAHNTVTTTTKPELAQYHHQSLFSPTVATLSAAINNHQLDSFPGLTKMLLKKLPPATATYKGHMHRNRKNIQSTRSNRDALLEARRELEDMNPQQQVCNTQEIDMLCFAALADAKEGVIYTDLPGPFPIRSIRNMQYVFVCYAYQPNAILVRPMKSRSAVCMCEAYRDIYDYLTERNFKPKLNITDNECSKAVKSYINSQDVAWQLAEPDNHRVNAAERAIQTFKNHFIAGLATVDPNFPMQLWCYLLQQAEISLNLLRTSRHDPTKSAYEVLEGPFDWNRTPLAPPGTRALIFEDPARRTTWGTHAIDGWCIGPAMEHYRCNKFFIDATRGIRTASTTKLFPAHCAIPSISEEDKTIVAAAELVKVLEAAVSIPTAAKIEHAKIINELTRIIENHPTSRVDTPTQTRVGTPTSSHDATAPRMLRKQKKVHQQRTRSNTPMPSIPEEPANDPSPASRKQPTRREKQRKQTNPTRVSPRREEKSTRPPTTDDYEIPGPPIPMPTFHFPMPKCGRAPRVPMVSQDDEDKTPLPTKVPQKASKPRDRPPPRRTARQPKSTSFYTPNSAINCTQEALYHVLGSGLENSSAIHTPANMQNGLTLNTNIDLAEVCNGVVDPDTNETLTNYSKVIQCPALRAVWLKAMCKELGNISQGYSDGDKINEKGTNTVRFLTHEEIKAIPKDRVITYARIVVDYRLQKDDPNRVRITVGGNLIDYPGELTTRTADLTTTKLMWNSVISTPGAKYACADIKSFYLETPLDRPEYMKMPLALIPEEFQDAYDLKSKAKNGFVYMEINKGMYGLPQAGILANKLLKKRLAKFGYFELPHTPGLWKHVSRPIAFTLVVDDFGIKYVGKQHLDHLLHAIRKDYTVEVDEKGGLYCGIELSWNYKKGYVDIAMPGYVKKQLMRYAHRPPPRRRYTPYDPAPVIMGKAAQNLPPPDESELLNEKEKKRVQQVVGSFLYYGRAVDLTILCALSEIAGQQAKPTQKTMDRVNKFLDYMASNPDAKIRYHASDMVLNVHSDASYLTAPKARSRVGGHFFLGSIPKDGCPIRLNGAILTNCTILKCVAASAAEAELGALFLNAIEAKIMRLTLEEMGHPQPPTPIHCDNTTAVGIVSNTIKRQRSRAMNMRYFWLLCHEAQRIFKINYHPGQENLGDYQTKNHNGAHHRRARPIYLHTDQSPKFLPRAARPSERRGCVKPSDNPYVGRTPLPRIIPT